MFSEDVDYKVNPFTGEGVPYLPEKISYWPAPTKRDQPSWAYKLKTKDQDLGSLFADDLISILEHFLQ